MSDPTTLCPVCQSALGEDTLVECPACHAMYHSECWQYNSGCAVYGCDQTPEVRPLDASEIPASYWGQEEKACPSCSRMILAAAVRCRFCGATFDARPQGADQFLEAAERRLRLPRIQRSVLILFIAALLPCSAPVVSVIGGLWLWRRRLDLKAAPSMYSALAWMGVLIAVLQTITMLAVVVVMHLRAH